MVRIANLAKRSAFMNQEKYIGTDLHQATISVAVMDAGGMLIMECLLETKGATIVEFIRGLHGTLWLTFEEGTSAAWLHDLLKPHLSRLVVCDPRKSALLKDGNKKMGWMENRAMRLKIRRGESSVGVRFPLPAAY